MYIDECSFTNGDVSSVKRTEGLVYSSDCAAYTAFDITVWHYLLRIWYFRGQQTSHASTALQATKSSGRHLLRPAPSIAPRCVARRYTKLWQDGQCSGTFSHSYIDSSLGSIVLLMVATKAKVVVVAPLASNRNRTFNHTAMLRTMCEVFLPSPPNDFAFLLRFVVPTKPFAPVTLSLFLLGLSSFFVVACYRPCIDARSG